MEQVQYEGHGIAVLVYLIKVQHLVMKISSSVKSSC